MVTIVLPATAPTLSWHDLRRAVDVDGAGAAQAGAAAVFRAGQPDMVADGPQQRGPRIGIDRDLAVVQSERNHVSSSRLPASCTSPLSGGLGRADGLIDGRRLERRAQR